MGINYKDLEDTIYRREFLSVSPGCDLEIRLIGLPIKIFKLFTKNNKPVMLDDEEVAQRLKNKYPGKLGRINIRFRCWCIDRKDEHIKILDMPITVAEAFSKMQSRYPHYDISGYDQGCDWRITTNNKQGIEVRYKTVCIDESPLSNNETEFVEVFGSLYEDFKLEKTTRFYSFEEAEKKLFG